MCLIFEEKKKTNSNIINAKKKTEHAALKETTAVASLDDERGSESVTMHCNLNILDVHRDGTIIIMMM